MTAKSRLIIVVATYNERGNLPPLVSRIWELLPHARILVVDDNSPDGTGQWVRETAGSEHRLELLHRDQKLGLGAATIAGMVHALKSKPDWVATMDADFSHDPQDLKAMWDRLVAPSSREIDVLIGSRYVSGGKIENWSIQRRLSSRLVNCFSRIVLRLRTTDNSGAFRLYRAEALRSIDLADVDCPGFVYLEQILKLLQRAGATIREHPITFRQRKRGQSKVNIVEVFGNLRDLLLLAFR